MLMVLVILFAESEGITFSCNFTDNFWSIENADYSCIVKDELTLSNNETSLESINGTHLCGKSNGDVKGLNVGNDRWLEQLPKNIEGFFSNLLAFSWWNGKLKSVTAEDFRPFPELIFLNLDVNEIVTLDGDLFAHIPRLVHFYFYSNFITNVGEDLLTSLKELKYAYLSDNPCISFSVTTPEKMQELKQKLLTQCPPLPSMKRGPLTPKTLNNSTTTTSTKKITTLLPESIGSENRTNSSTSTKEDCNIRCSVNEEVDSLKKQLSKQTQVNELLNRMIFEVRQEISQLSFKNDERFLEMEKKLREVRAGH